MLLRHMDFRDRPTSLAMKNSEGSTTKNENIPAYIMASLGNMSYMAGTDFRYNLPQKTHVLIGNYCQIAHDTVFEIGMNHVFSGVSPYPFDQVLGEENIFAHRAPVNKQQLVIGHDVWMGSGVRIIKAVKIGNGAIIGSGSVVTKDVPPYAIVGGNPAKIIRYRFAPEIIQALNKIKWWYWPLEKVKANRQYMENVEEFIARFGEKIPKVENIAVSSSASAQEEPPTSDREAAGGNSAVDKPKNSRTLVPPRILKKLQACHQTGGRIFYFVPDLGSAREDAVWPAVLGQVCQKYGNQRHCLLLALRQDASDHQAQIQYLQQFMGQFPNRPEPIFFGSPDGIVRELLKQADYFITTKEAISSKGIDYMDTFGGGVLSGLEYDIFADV